jgi:hypothetical protein
MNDEFTLSINYKGGQKDYPARLLLQGYAYKICVVVDETEVYFEPDEEGSFRVVKLAGQDEKNLEKIDKRLLQELKEKIEEIVR